MLTPHYEITLSDAEQQRLQALVRAGKTPQQLVTRASIILLAQDGLPNQQIANEVGTSRNLVQKWRKRFARLAPVGLPTGFFPRWRGTRSSPSPAKGLRSESLGAFRSTACAIWPAWSPGGGGF
jgi:hypothetical protein